MNIQIRNRDIHTAKVGVSGYLPKKISSQTAKEVCYGSNPSDKKAIMEDFPIIYRPGVKLTGTQSLEKMKFLCFYNYGDTWLIGNPAKPRMLKHLNGFNYIHLLLRHRTG